MKPKIVWKSPDGSEASVKIGDEILRCRRIKMLDRWAWVTPMGRFGAWDTSK
jgi:hypothetical protein